jgi:hypothetical protein
MREFTRVPSFNEIAVLAKVRLESCQFGFPKQKTGRSLHRSFRSSESGRYQVHSNRHREKCRLSCQPNHPHMSIRSRWFGWIELFTNVRQQKPRASRRRFGSAGLTQHCQELPLHHERPISPTKWKRPCCRPQSVRRWCADTCADSQEPCARAPHSAGADRSSGLTDPRSRSPDLGSRADQA